MEDCEENNITGQGCGYVCPISFIRGRKRSKTIKDGWILLQQQEEIIEDGWAEKKAKKVKEISKVLASPRWKNWLIRRLGTYRIKKRRPQFHYDPQSYALNFENGKNTESNGTGGDFLPRFGALDLKPEGK